MNASGWRAVLLVFLLVGSMLTAGTGNVAAAESTKNCSELDEFFWVLSWGRFWDHCDPSVISDEMEELRSNTNDATQLDLYNGLVGQEIQSENLLVTIDSYSQDGRTPAFVKAENATIEALYAGETKAGVNRSARTAVNDYYTEAQQMRLVDGWNIAVSQLDYVSTRADNTTGLSADGVTDLHGGVDAYSGHPTGWTFINLDGFKFTYQGTTSKAYTYANGTTENVTMPQYSLKIIGDWEGDTGTVYNNASTEFATSVTLAPDGTWTYTGRDMGGLIAEDGSLLAGGPVIWDFHLDNVTAVPPDGSSLVEEVYLEQPRWTNTFSGTSTTAVQVRDNAELYASALYDADQNGTLDAANYTSGYVMAQEYATDYNSTGYWSYAIGLLSSSGVSTPDLNGTGVMTVDYNGVTYEGLIMAAEAPNGTWETGVQYDTANLGNRTWLVTTNGERLEMDGTFTLQEMTDQNGNAVNSTKQVTYVYEGVNMTDYNNLQKQVLELMTEIQEREPTGTGTGSSSGGWPPFGLTEAQAAIGAVVVLGGGALGLSNKR